MPEIATKDGSAYEGPKPIERDGFYRLTIGLCGECMTRDYASNQFGRSVYCHSQHCVFGDGLTPPIPKRGWLPLHRDEHGDLVGNPEVHELGRLQA